MAAADAKAPRPKPSHPSFLEMAKDALISLGDKKGSSVQAITTFIAGKHNLDPDFVRQHLKPALAKGLEKESFVRPKGSESKGFTGRFKANKDKLKEETKKKPEKEAKTKDAAKVKDKKPAKTTVVKKTASKSTPKKSAKSPKKRVAKSPGKAAKAASKAKSASAEKKPKTAKLKTPKTPLKTPRSKSTKKA